MELRAWPVFKPHNSELIASPPMAGILGEMNDELGYMSFLAKLGQDEIRYNEYNESGKRLMNRRREAKVSDVGGKKMVDFCQVLYTSIAEIKGFRFRLERSFFHAKAQAITHSLTVLEVVRPGT